MVTRSREEWLGLFDEQARSGLTAYAFCKARGLCSKHFSLRRKQLGWTQRASAAPVFVRVEKALMKKATFVPVAESRVLLRLGRCEWELRGMSEDGLLRLMAALA